MKKYLREFTRQAFAPATVFSALAATFFLTLAGPFGTYDGLTLMERAIYWGLVIGIAILIVYAIKVFVESRFSRLVFWKQAIVVSVSFTLIYTPVLAALAFGLTGDKREVTPIWLMYVVVFSASMAIIQLRYFLFRDQGGADPPIFRRLGNISASRIRHVTVRDHHVVVHTDKGAQTLLMRFSDALEELRGLDGMRVHRSHWVASDAVRGLRRTNGRVFLVLDDDSEVPVSRAARKDVEDRFS